MDYEKNAKLIYGEEKQLTLFFFLISEKESSSQDVQE